MPFVEKMGYKWGTIERKMGYKKGIYNNENFIFGHLNKSIISYRNMIDSGLILVPKFIRRRNTYLHYYNVYMGQIERAETASYALKWKFYVVCL